MDWNDLEEWILKHKTLFSEIHMNEDQDFVIMFIRCALVRHLYITDITAYIVVVSHNIIMIRVKMLKQKSFLQVLLFLQYFFMSEETPPLEKSESV